MNSDTPNSNHDTDNMLIDELTRAKSEFVRVDRDHDIGGMVSYFYLNQERADDPSSGHVAYNHEAGQIHVNVTFSGVKPPAEVARWAGLMLEVVAYAKEQEK